MRAGISTTSAAGFALKSTSGKGSLGGAFPTDARFFAAAAFRAGAVPLRLALAGARFAFVGGFRATCVFVLAIVPSGCGVGRSCQRLPAASANFPEASGVRPTSKVTLSTLG